MHGKTSLIRHSGTGVFTGLPQPLEATRYHSLIVDRDTVPDVLEITAETDDGLVMGLRHRDAPTEGVQFHPESILTVGGHDLVGNFLAQVDAYRRLSRPPRRSGPRWRSWWSTAAWSWSWWAVVVVVRRWSSAAWWWWAAAVVVGAVGGGGGRGGGGLGLGRRRTRTMAGPWGSSPGPARSAARSRAPGRRSPRAWS